MNVVRRFAIGFESKEEGQLLTLDAFADMIDFEEKLSQLSAKQEDGTTLYYKDYCLTFFDQDLDQEVSLKDYSNMCTLHF